MLKKILSLALFATLVAGIAGANASPLVNSTNHPKHGHHHGGHHHGHKGGKKG